MVMAAGDRELRKSRAYDAAHQQPRDHQTAIAKWLIDQIVMPISLPAPLIGAAIVPSRLGLDIAR